MKSPLGDAEPLTAATIPVTNSATGRASPRSCTRALSSSSTRLSDGLAKVVRPISCSKPRSCGKHHWFSSSVLVYMTVPGLEKFRYHINSWAAKWCVSSMIWHRHLKELGCSLLFMRTRCCSLSLPDLTSSESSQHLQCLEGEVKEGTLVYSARMLGLSFISLYKVPMMTTSWFSGRSSTPLTAEQDSYEGQPLRHS